MLRSSKYFHGLIISVACAFLFIIGFASAESAGGNLEKQDFPTKLSWFIPDGLRAEPDVFTLFKWAEEGKLPNIKRMMEMGSYGYSIPVFPSHTPANFAALLTGMYPKTNGVPDGPMRVEGQTLQKPAVAGFSSGARKVPAVWGSFGNDKKVVLLSMPGSTPPELKHNAITIRGRWGGWGADIHSVIYEKMSIEQRTKLARNSRLFMQGMELTQYIEPDSKWKWPASQQHLKEQFLKMEYYGTPLYAKLHQKNNASGGKYNAVSFSRDMNSVDVVLQKGQWSKWFPVTITWNNRKINSNIKYHLIGIGPDNFFRIRVLADNLNDFIVEPSQVASELESGLGQMVDFPDNFPPQLVYYLEDKDTFLTESKLSIDWHRKAVDSIYSRYKPDIFIHDIYTPNQMLTSRWWMGYIDSNSARYNDVSKKERARLWEEVKDMYKGIDAIVGKTLDNADKDTLIVFSSDHGVIPLDVSVQLNNLFAKKGWITYTINPGTGEPTIDWQKTKVFFLKMSNVYINPNGLGPTYQRVSGPAYEQLRNEVIEALQLLKDEKGNKPLDVAVKWEDVERILKLPPDRSGDLIIANKSGYGWAEDITTDLKLFAVPQETGYKQAVIAENVKGLWAPFIIAGKGIRKNYAIKQPISNIDQLPTIFRAMNMDAPKNIEGSVLNEIFKSPN
jgi:predicted AlkP superfamily phosphohydrolase/phosphomutase